MSDGNSHEGPKEVPTRELVYMENDDGSYKVAMIPVAAEGESVKTVKESLLRYAPQDEEYLLATYPKNGTHLGWEIMHMLIYGKADYLKTSKICGMIDVQSMEKIDKSTPRVLNTHFRLDVLPKNFRKMKTITILRNPKDTAVSLYFMLKNMVKIIEHEITFEDYLNNNFLKSETEPYGCFFKYAEYMWEAAKNSPNILLLLFEDIKNEPVEAVRKIDKFLGTERDENLIQEIAAATDFKKMKEGKIPSEIQARKQFFESGKEEKDNRQDQNTPPNPASIYRKGMIGDWKNYFTVAMNERFDEIIENWKAGSEIPFTYE